jgi:hypothetical protein
MYTVYTYNSTANGGTVGNIIADVCAIYCGETNPANLSSACNKPLTNILATTPAGWTMHDAAAGGGARVVRAPCVDDPSNFKYLRISESSATLYLHGFETFNATTHVGTNMTANASSTSSTDAQTLDLTNGGEIYLASSARFLILVKNSPAAASSQWGSSSRGFYIFAETSRLQPWDTVAASYPRGVLIHSYQALSSSKHVYFSRVKNASGSDLISSSASAYFGTIGVSRDDLSSTTHFPSGSSTKVRNASGTFEIPFLPLYLVSMPDFVAPIGDITSTCDIWLLPLNVVSNLETVQKGSQEFIALMSGPGGQLIAVPKS